MVQTIALVSLAESLKYRRLFLIFPALLCAGAVPTALEEEQEQGLLVVHRARCRHRCHVLRVRRRVAAHGHHARDGGVQVSLLAFAETRAYPCGIYARFLLACAMGANPPS